jgi:hypothetical protein
MSGRHQNAMLLIARETELPVDARVWGDGGWQAPEDREALDWLTLARISGWKAAVAYDNDFLGRCGASKSSRWIIVAHNPEDLGEEAVAELSLRVQSEPILLVSRAAIGGSAMARLSGVSRQANRSLGKDLHWIGPGPSGRWACRNPVEFTPLHLSRDVSIWATLDGAPVIAAPMGLRRDRDAGISPQFCKRHRWRCDSPAQTSPGVWRQGSGCLVGLGRNYGSADG